MIGIQVLETSNKRKGSLKMD